MTLRTALRELARRAWVLPVVAVIVGAGAFLIASRHHQRWTATAIAIHTPVKTHPGVKGLRRLQLEHLPAPLAISTDYGHPPADVVLTPNAGRSVRISASGPSRAAVTRSLGIYTGRLERRWKAQFATARSRVLAAIQTRSSSKHVTAEDVARAIAAVNTVTPTISISTIVATQTSNPLQPAASAALGAGSGLLLGVVLILAVYAARGQIWEEEELAPLGAAVVAVDSTRPSDLHRLRVELEARGLTRRRRSVLILSAGRKDGWSRIAMGLADAFAEVPYELVVVDAIGSPDAAASPGVSQFLADPSGGLAFQQVSAQIRYVAPGGRGADRTITADGVAALLAESEKLGRITIVDGPSLDTPISALFAAEVDLCVVTVQRGATTAGAVTAAVARIRRSAGADPVICFDNARRRPRRGASAVGVRQDAVVERAAVAADSGR